MMTFAFPAPQLPTILRPMTDSEYQKVPKVHRLYQDLQKLLDEGAWVCDAVDHVALIRSVV